MLHVSRFAVTKIQIPSNIMWSHRICSRFLAISFLKLQGAAAGQLAFAPRSQLSMVVGFTSCYYCIGRKCSCMPYGWNTKAESEDLAHWPAAKQLPAGEMLKLWRLLLTLDPLKTSAAVTDSLCYTFWGLLAWSPVSKSEWGSSELATFQRSLGALV
jgi:hypothetical protein